MAHNKENPCHNHGWSSRSCLGIQIPKQWRGNHLAQRIDRNGPSIHGHKFVIISWNFSRLDLWREQLKMQNNNCGHYLALTNIVLNWRSCVQIQSRTVEPTYLLHVWIHPRWYDSEPNEHDARRCIGQYDRSHSGSSFWRDLFILYHLHGFLIQIATADILYLAIVSVCIFRQSLLLSISAHFSISFARFRVSNCPAKLLTQHQWSTRGQYSFMHLHTCYVCSSLTREEDNHSVDLSMHKELFDLKMNKDFFLKRLTERNAFKNVLTKTIFIESWDT